ncbi:MAG: tetratricopeptide repeat protein [Elusimicrobiales bacterium]|nr:tetratricopeptide repeat protein [Elusimicrobiales bacterium]
MTRKTRLILLALVVSLCYANTARNDFMWDDDQYIANNERIASIGNLPGLLAPVAGEPYRPLRMITFALERSLFGLNPMMYHLDNVAIHLANVLLLFAVLLLIFKDEELAFYSALIFAIYPAWNEAIVWVKNRSMLLAGFFMLSGLYFYIKKKHLPALLAVVLGLMSKEIVVAFPAIATAYAFIFEKERRKTDLLPYWALGIAWTVFLFAFYGGQAGSYAPGPAFFFSLKIMLKFMLILFYPFRMNAEREVSFPETIFDAEVLASFVLTFAALVWIYRDRFRNKPVSFLLLWMVFNIFPTANPGVVAGRPLGEHRLYIVGAGFSVLIFLALRQKKALLYALLPVLFISSFLRNLDWRDSFSFWDQTVKVSPLSPRAHTNLALAYSARGDAAKAKEHLRRALELDPGYTVATRSLAGLFAKENRISDANSLLTGALRNYPGDIPLYVDLIDLYLGRRMIREAADLCVRAVALVDINAGSSEDYMAIGIQAFRLGLLKEAERVFAKVAGLRPWSGYVANNLASVYHADKNYPLAEKYYRLAIENQPSNPVYYYNLGNLYYNMGDTGKAVESFTKTVELDKNYADAWHNLGYVYKASGNFEEADRCFRKVTELERPPTPDLRG